MILTQSMCFLYFPDPGDELSRQHRPRNVNKVDDDAGHFVWIESQGSSSARCNESVCLLFLEPPSLYVPARCGRRELDVWR